MPEVPEIKLLVEKIVVCTIQVRNVNLHAPAEINV